MSGDDSSGVLGRLRAWLGSLFGGGTDTDSLETGTETEVETAEPSDAGTADATEQSSSEAEQPTATHVCLVCGTDVADPDGGCPLCGSTDVRARSPTDAADGVGSGPSPTATATESTVDGEASRLRDLRDGTTDAEVPTDEGGGGDTSEPQ